jgi:hypothetical protein
MRNCNTPGDLNFNCDTPLQVIDSPDAKGNGGNNTAEAKDENWSVSTVQSGSNAVANFLCVTTARTRALGASKSRALLLEVHTSAFSLEE